MTHQQQQAAATGTNQAAGAGIRATNASPGQQAVLAAGLQATASNNQAAGEVVRSRIPILSNSSTGSLEIEMKSRELESRDEIKHDSPLPPRDCSPGNATGSSLPGLLTGTSGSIPVPHQDNQTGSNQPTQQPRQQFNEAISLIKKIKTRYDSSIMSHQYQS